MTIANELGIKLEQSDIFEICENCQFQTSYNYGTAVLLELLL